jgi:hypothetical protein
VHFRGHVNRQLRGLRFESGGPAAAGTELRDAGGKVVGAVRSGTRSPRLGAIALALVRHEVEPGAVVTVDGQQATVVELPFRD